MSARTCLPIRLEAPAGLPTLFKRPVWWSQGNRRPYGGIAADAACRTGLQAAAANYPGIGAWTSLGAYPQRLERSGHPEAGGTVRAVGRRSSPDGRMKVGCAADKRTS